MSWAHSISHKYRALLFLWILLAVLLLGHWWNGRQYAAIEKSVNSLYNDRLMPATWLFQLNSYVYERAGKHTTDTTGQGAMQNLVKAYEATYLTRTEAGDWKQFKKYWNDFLQSPNSPALADSLHQCMLRLSRVQASVGQELQKESSTLLSNAQLTAWIEMAILFVFAIMGFMLARAIQEHKANLNDAQMN